MSGNCISAKVAIMRLTVCSESATSIQGRSWLPADSFLRGKLGARDGQ